jgi:hypothetical protein
MVKDMAGLRFQVKEELERKFREAAMKRFGYRKGALSRAAEEALQKWLASISMEEEVFRGDPVKAIEGLLADVNLDSVELQHLVKKMWTSKVPTDVSN